MEKLFSNPDSAALYSAIIIISIIGLPRLLIRLRNLNKQVKGLKETEESIQSAIDLSKAIRKNMVRRGWEKIFPQN